VQLGRSPRFHGQHVSVPRHGVAVQINAFQFSGMGTGEKAASALLAGMPVLSKPATSSAMVAHRVMEILVEKKVLPEGALSLSSVRRATCRPCSEPKTCSRSPDPEIRACAFARSPTSSANRCA